MAKQKTLFKKTHIKDIDDAADDHVAAKARFAIARDDLLEAADKLSDAMEKHKKTRYTTASNVIVSYSRKRVVKTDQSTVELNGKV